MNKKIAIIGMGHMGKAFFYGLIAGGLQKENIITSDNAENNNRIAESAEWIIVAVKPQIISQVIAEMKDNLKDKMLISVAAGVDTKSLANFTGNSNQKIVRLMPNLSVAYKEGIVGLFVNDLVSSDEKESIKKELSGLGKIIDCSKEEDLDAITITAGSGPALVAYCIAMLAQSGREFGLSDQVANEIALQTFFGTLALLKKTGQTPSELQTAVATKGGITEAIIENLDKEEITSRFIRSLEMGYVRIKKIKENV